jgi:4-hydroxy-3-methylbut-2-enyl diphosphate reductase
MEIAIAKNAGFCFGVTNAVKTAEKYLSKHDSLYCLGDIVHNDAEGDRLAQLGLQELTLEEYKKLKNTTVLIRAHGEPPETYQFAHENNIELIDATCPVVLNLQKNIKKIFEKDPSKQIAIAGKHGHAEVVGLLGQTNQQGMVISKIEEIDKIDFTRPLVLFTQTTFDVDYFMQMVEEIKQRYQNLGKEKMFSFFDTTCKQVCNRKKQILKFVENYDLILFVSGEKSSNGLQLYNKCKENNPNSYFVTSMEIIDLLSFDKVQSIGICGATSTPMWLMESVKDKVIEKLKILGIIPS